MKLSEAIILGDSLRTRNPYKYLSRDEDTWCGCAIGGAQLAVGNTYHLLHGDVWPWLNDTHAEESTFDNEISSRFYTVCDGDMTLEELADWVCSVEPKCGECNRFECTCVKPESKAEAFHFKAI